VTGAELAVEEQVGYERALERQRGQLGEARLGELSDEGRRLPGREALELRAPALRLRADRLVAGVDGRRRRGRPAGEARLARLNDVQHPAAQLANEAHEAVGPRTPEARRSPGTSSHVRPATGIERPHCGGWLSASSRQIRIGPSFSSRLARSRRAFRSPPPSPRRT